MGRPEHDGAASPFGFGTSPPLSGASSPSPLLPAPNHGTTRFGGRRRNAVVRLICSPFAAVFGTACSAGAAAHDVDRATRRPSLEELLRMEASSSDLLDVKQPKEPAEMVDTYDDDDDEDSWKQSAIVVFDLGKDGDKSRPIIDDEKIDAPLAVSEDPHGAITCPGDEKEPEEELDAGGGGGAMLSPKALVNVERLVVVLASLGARSRALKGSYGRLAAGRRVDDGKAELFYDRPIPLGRRCRVQHLEESPYL
ncbi:hypothetical protein CFC21_107398 [Triticum aestivum]|nr:uncharacterized protein LOC109750506 [Aegilops tauschii subsp. strangulata]XP_044441767.1 uncharacterized protein LOC123167973 [Triticum aestivum]KAF7106680.1 hypothetical protein CFC21_107398 [Triticum aestivum]